MVSYRLIQHNSAEERVHKQQVEKLLFAADVTGDTKLSKEQIKIRLTFANLFDKNFFTYVYLQQFLFNTNYNTDTAHFQDLLL